MSDATKCDFHVIGEDFNGSHAVCTECGAEWHDDGQGWRASPRSPSATPDPASWEVYEDLRSRYANACERMGMAHANGTRAEWEDAAHSEVERRLALNAAVRSLSRATPDRAEAGENSATATDPEDEIEILRTLVANMSLWIGEVLAVEGLPLTVRVRSALCSLQEYATAAKERASRVIPGGGR